MRDRLPITVPPQPRLEELLLELFLFALVVEEIVGAAVVAAVVSDDNFLMT